MNSTPRRVRAVMFDLDGTLIDTMGEFADLAAEIMSVRLGLPRALARRRYLETSGIPFRQQLDVILSGPGAGPGPSTFGPGHPANDAAAAEFEQRKRAVCDMARMTVATRAGLDRLRAAGMKLVVSSNAAQHFVDEFAAHERIRFDLALGFDAARGLAKGIPHVAHACRTLGVARDEIVFCGDSLQDGELARGCEIAFVGRLGTFTRDEFRRWDAGVQVVDDVAALAALLIGKAAA